MPEASTDVTPCVPFVAVTVVLVALLPSFALTLVVTGVLTTVTALSGTPTGLTVTLMVAVWLCVPKLSATVYAKGVVVPVKVAKGVKVTTPVDVLTVNVPWLATVTEVFCVASAGSVSKTEPTLTVPSASVSPVMAFIFTGVPGLVEAVLLVATGTWFTEKFRPVISRLVPGVEACNCRFGAPAWMPELYALLVP